MNRRCESPLILGDLDPPHAHIATPRVVLTPPSSTKSPISSYATVRDRGVIAFDLISFDVTTEIVGSKHVSQEPSQHDGGVGAKDTISRTRDLVAILIWNDCPTHLCRSSRREDHVASLHDLLSPTRRVTLGDGCSHANPVSITIDGRQVNVLERGPGRARPLYLRRFRCNITDCPKCNTIRALIRDQFINSAHAKKSSSISTIV